jgi:UDP-GlcNAc:undecaprenyl-phosphate GlcNAc-1-phosphate transferase
MAVPLFDSTAAMVRRKLTGRSIFSGDRGHLHHRLSERFGSTRAVAIVAASCGVCGAAALASIVWRNELVAVVSGAAIIVMFVVARMFGHSELRLLAARLQATTRSLFRFRLTPRSRNLESAVHLQGDREWHLAWLGLTEAAEGLAVHQIELNVNAPMIQEGFHASWRRNQTDPEDAWRFEMPLYALGQRIGSIRASGARLVDRAASDLERLLHLFDSFESQLESLCQPSGEVFVGEQPRDAGTKPADPPAAPVLAMTNHAPAT